MKAMSLVKKNGKKHIYGGLKSVFFFPQFIFLGYRSYLICEHPNSTCRSSKYNHPFVTFNYLYFKKNRFHVKFRVQFRFTDIPKSFVNERKKIPIFFRGFIEISIINADVTTSVLNKEGLPRNVCQIRLGKTSRWNVGTFDTLGTFRRV